MRAALVYPHQLFDPHPALQGAQVCFLVEDPLFFSQYRWHAHKLVLHRSAMQHLADKLRRRRMKVEYVEARQLGRTEDIVPLLRQRGVTEVQLVDLCDDWLQRRLERGCRGAGIDLRILPDPHFLTPREVIADFAAGRDKWFFTDFYVAQRKRLNILVDDRGGPVGGKWSFDAENRRKLPAGIEIPPIKWPPLDRHVREAQSYVTRQFPDAYGDPASFHYPVTSKQALDGLTQFLDHRFAQFGDYEDAIDADEPFLFHSLLTPALNCGLLSPQQVIDAALDRADSVPLNALEGFVRQVIGWREYMRGVYLHLGRKQRTRNFWSHSRPIPAAFYDGTTGVEPVDVVIRRVLQHSYCHHIERLMILGNFMLLCEMHPTAVYRWFMELFIDAYDWVMVPNVYGMSQHADGGLITTKPYISGSNYVLKMSRFRKGPWCDVWDALYWRFIHRHRDFFAANPRMSVMVSACDRLGNKLQVHLRTAEEFLNRLYSETAGDHPRTVSRSERSQ
jgi:deoxyribodipyrimidine photolyase-related protein